jgi:plastocyanin
MDLDGGIFWYFGGALVLAALVVSFIGIRGRATFPPSGGVMYGGIAAVAALVVGAGAFGVANASEEQDHRNAELAEEEAEAAGEVAETGDEVTGTPGGQPGGETPEVPGAAPGGEQQGDQGDASPVGGSAQTFDITSPADGSLAFDPSGLQGSAGLIKIAYANVSPVGHNVAIEDDQQQTLAESDTVTNDDTEVSAELVPGEYIYYCTIPGHREGGMEGVLTVE